MDNVELQNLLQQAEQLSASINGSEDFPRLEKNINQILQNSSELWSKTGSGCAGSVNSVAKASVLLGSKGLDLTEMQNHLKKLEDVPVLQSMEASAEQDLESLLRNERQNVIVGLIEENSKKVLEDSQRRHWDSMMRNWHMQKQQILTTLLASQDLMVDLTLTSNAATSDTMTSKHISTQHNLTPLEMLYARQLAILNEKYVNKNITASSSSPDPSLFFQEVGRLSGDSFTQDVWELVTSLTLNWDSSRLSAPTMAQIDDESSVLNSSTFAEVVFNLKLSNGAKSQIVKISLSYLQSRFKKYVHALVYDNLTDASLGGVPSVMKLAKSYLSLTNSKSFPSSCQFEDGRIEGIPVWALLYVCLRIGDPHAALEVGQRAPQGLGDFYPVLEELAKTKCNLSYNTVVQLRLFYKRIVHKSNDLYKKVVYCVLAQCDFMDNHSIICDKVEDYLWLKLSQVNTNNNVSDPVGSPHKTNPQDASSSDILTLEKFQSLILEHYGETHFQAKTQPFTYFQVLWLSGLYEDAIEFLSNSSHLRSHAVHIALALRSHGLLLPSDAASGAGQVVNIKKVKSTHVKLLNFSRLVMLYVKNFEKTNPAEALQYYFLLRDFPFMDASFSVGSQSNDSMFLQCVADLVTETRDYVTIFGTRDFNDVRHPGLLDSLDPDNTPHVIAKVGSICEKRGMFEDAVYLYDLSGKKDQALVVLNKLLVPLVPSKSTKGGTRDRVVNIALEIAERYKKKGFVGNQSVLKTFYFLLDLVTFHDLFNWNDLDAALEVAENLNILPKSVSSDANGDEAAHIHLERLLDNFKALSEEIKQCFPEILLCCMKIIAAKYSQINKSSSCVSPNLTGGGASRSGFEQSSSSYYSKQELRAKARLLTTFVGRMPYRLPGDVNTQMAQMELMMN